MDAVRGMIELVKLVKNNCFIKEEVETLGRKVRRLTSRRADIQSELERVELSSNKKRKHAVENWLADVDTTENKVRRLEVDMRRSKLGWDVRWQSLIGNLIKEIDELNGITFEGGLVFELRHSNKVPFTVSKLVGRGFEINRAKIWNWMTSDEVLSLGIYGMGGVGKTTLMMHIYNQFLEERPTNFSNIYWVTVSKDFSIYKLQDHIAKEIGFDLCDEDDEKKRAARLREALKKRQRSVLILDDIWNQFNPDEIGLPINLRACKLILTTRSLDVCRRMSCQKKMILEPLSEEESWYLFTHTLENYAILSLEVQQTAKLVADECAGLPLGLVALARSMTGVDDIREWRSVLEQLTDSRFGPPEMENKVFEVLNLSFDRLRDPELQECFLYCALFPEDFKIPRKKLIQYLVNDEIIKGPTSRKAQVDKVHALLNKLENVGLLQGVQDKYLESYVKMHDLIRDMAIRKSPKAMVKPGKQLRELPNASSWQGHARASFMYNKIKDVPGDYSPLYTELSSLLLSGNGELRDIGNGFFTHMWGLRILDLSEINIFILPDSLSNLVNLTSLLLRRCMELHYIPSLATLRKLQELDLFGCFKLEQVPAGLEILSNLWYLDLDKTKITDLLAGLFSHNLSNLEHLGLPCCSPLDQRLACCDKLDYLSCTVQSPRDFIGMVTDDVQWLSPSNYTIRVGEGKAIRFNSWANCKKVVVFYKCDIGEGGEFFSAPSTGFDVAYIESCHSLMSLDKFHYVDDGGVASQREVSFLSCDSLECLISQSCILVPSSMVNHVVELRLEFLSNLRFLIHIAQPLSNDVFSCLRVLEVIYCQRIQSLFTFELLTNLQNLEEITVEHCDEMEELIMGGGIKGVATKPSLLVDEASSSHYDNESAEFISLPKLRVFRLLNLSQLKSICSKKMSYGSLEEIELWGCRKLERIPFSLVQLENGRPSPLTSLKEIRICQQEQEWWNSVEFDFQLPDIKYVLEPLVKKLPYDQLFVEAAFAKM